MRIERVTAHGFGPLAGQTLALAPGLTVIAGDNESGKSSWHAATFAALCGRRRGRGRPSAQEQQFIDAHQPWDGGPWGVSCIVRLDDGRRIELRQDLSGKVDCRATDTGLARDVSSEIIVDGSPDASAWLGLTRDGFRATACVGQAEVLAVLEAADGLQHALQRAAATAGSAGTAARAIELLEACRRTAVGRDTASAVRPLRRAREAVAAAQEQLRAATEAQQDFSVVAEQADRLAAEADAAKRRADAAAAEAAALAEELRTAGRSGSPARPPARAAVATRPLRRPRRWLAAGLLAATAGVLVAAVALGSGVVGAAGAVLAALAGWAVWSGSRSSGGRSSGGRWGGGRRGGGAVVSTREGALAKLSYRPGPELPPDLLDRQRDWVEQQAVADGARRRHHEAAVMAGRADAVRAERGVALPSVAEAEEALAAAHRELTRVVELDETLSLTIGFLSQAQESVHRQVAPELTGLLRAWLPQLTGGRYVDARLDPALLAVEVCGPDSDFRRADRLSHGTAEQIYLLLRVALAAQLTAGHDTCPLLLDDVTVHADPQRTDQLLEMLYELSRDRQIVLFAQQEQVREWARTQLDGEFDALIELAPAGPAAPAGPSAFGT